MGIFVFTEKHFLTVQMISLAMRCKCKRSHTSIDRLIATRRVALFISTFEGALSTRAANFIRAQLHIALASPLTRCTVCIAVPGAFRFGGLATASKAVTGIRTRAMKYTATFVRLLLYAVLRHVIYILRMSNIYIDQR